MIDQDNEVFQFSFYVPKQKKKLHYFLIKNGCRFVSEGKKHSLYETNNCEIIPDFASIKVNREHWLPRVPNLKEYPGKTHSFVSGREFKCFYL